MENNKVENIKKSEISDVFLLIDWAPIENGKFKSVSIQWSDRESISRRVFMIKS